MRDTVTQPELGIYARISENIFGGGGGGGRKLSVIVAKCRVTLFLQ